MPGIELPHHQPAAVAVEMPPQIEVERGSIEAVALHHRDGVGVSRNMRGQHTGLNLEGAPRVRQTGKATMRNAISERDVEDGGARNRRTVHPLEYIQGAQPAWTSAPPRRPNVI